MHDTHCVVKRYFMKILRIYPKDVYIQFEMGVKDAVKLLNSLEGIEVNYDTEKRPEMAEAVEYLKVFYKVLDEAVEEINGPSGNKTESESP